MEELIKAIISLDFWGLFLLVIVTIVGSSAASALVTGIFESVRQSRSFRREVRRDALDAIGDAYVVYLKYGNEGAPVTVNPARDQEVSERSAKMQVAVASIGVESLLPLAQEFAKLGESFASQDETTSVAAVNGKFTEIIKKISKQIPAK